MGKGRPAEPPGSEGFRILYICLGGRPCLNHVVLVEGKAEVVEKVEAKVLRPPQDLVETGLLQLVILLEADAKTLPQKSNK